MTIESGFVQLDASIFCRLLGGNPTFKENFKESLIDLRGVSTKKVSRSR